MKKQIFVKSFMLSVIAGVFATGIIVQANQSNGPEAFNGLIPWSDGMYHLELYAKDANWNPIAHGPFGKMQFNIDRFNFEGHDLKPNTNYTLIRQSYELPGITVCMGSALSTDGGSVNIAGELLYGGPKVWLVLSSDVNCAEQTLPTFNPTEYLFEYNFINLKLLPYTILHEEHSVYPGMEHAHLYTKDEAWRPVQGAGLGVLHYNDSEYKFSAKRIKPLTNFTLLRFRPGRFEKSTCLGTSVSTADGTLSLEGPLPAGGPKPWLVFSRDVDCSRNIMVGWHRDDYLFEGELIPDTSKPGYGPHKQEVQGWGDGADPIFYMYHKDDEWKIIVDDTIGLLKINGNKFEFNGHKLATNTNYTLVRVRDDNSLTCLGEAQTTNGENLEIKGNLQGDGPKVWLVLSNDVNCNTGVMASWNPSSYLFEHRLLN